MKKIGLSVLLSFSILSINAQKKLDKKVGAHIYDHDTTIVDDNDNIYKVDNLGDKINSRHIESGPRISPDGKSLYFFRVNHPKNYSHTRDIWVSHYNEVDSAWGEAEHLKPPLNNYGDNSVHSISPDGQTLLLHNVYLKNGLTKNGVSISHWNESKEKWSFPEEVKIKGYKNDQTCSFYLCNDMKTMILAIQGKDSYGQQDLYVSFKDEKDKWSKPLNMGPKVNTQNSEATAFMFSDGETLYYSSNGLPSGSKGLGGYDIYKTSRLDSTWTNWSTPVNMGSPWNTKDDEFYFSIPEKGDYSYLSHHFKGADSLDHSDLVRIKMIPNPSLYMHGVVYDYFTKERIEANVAVRKTSPNTEGIFNGLISDSTSLDLNLNSKSIHSFSFTKEGYVAYDSIIDLMDLKVKKEDTVKFYLKRIPQVTIIALDEETGDTLVTALTSIYKDGSDDVYKSGKPVSPEKTYTASLDMGAKYAAVISDGEYYVEKKIDLVDLTNGTANDTVITIKLKPIYADAEFDIPNIYFLFGKAELDPKSYESLDELAAALKKHEVILKAEIGGHTDSRGSTSANQKLSEKRAQAIVDYLKKDGIKVSRLQAKGYGESELTNKCSDGVKCTEEEHLANRRVVLKVLEVKKRRKSRN